MRKFGLIGDPISKSGSPFLFRAAYRNEEQEDGSPYSYDLIDGSDFEASWDTFIKEYSAINVTAPFKEKAYARVEELSELGKGLVSGPAARIGASNLLVKTSEGIAAHNSDFTGIVVAVAEAYYPGIVEEFIKEYGSNFCIKVHQFFLMSLGRRFTSQPQALIVGCGGAGRAAAVAAAELGFATVLMNRTEDKAREIAEAMPEYGFLVDPIADFKEALRECDLVIYTVPAAIPQIQELSADHFLQEGCSCDSKVILEANYKDPSFDEGTRMKIAAAEGIYIPGTKWLLYQALTGYPLMTGLEPDLDAMKQSLLGTVFG